jgi:hypothetical protein
MSWLDLTEDRIKEFLSEDIYPSIRSIFTSEEGTIRRFRAECRTGYLNIGRGKDRECCPHFISSPPKLASDIDFNYHPMSPAEILDMGYNAGQGRGQGLGYKTLTKFMLGLVREMTYPSELINKDEEAIRPQRRKPIEAHPVVHGPEGVGPLPAHAKGLTARPVIVEKRSGDWVACYHWEEGAAFFSTWGHPSTEPEDPLSETSRPHVKNHHFSLDIVTKDHLFYRYDIEQYIVTVFGIWEHMHQIGYIPDRDGLNTPTNSRGATGLIGLDQAEGLLIIHDWERLVNGNKVILRATKEPTRGINFTVADETNPATGEWNPRPGTNTSPAAANQNAALQLASVINANENFNAGRAAPGRFRGVLGTVTIEQRVPGLPGETLVTIQQDQSTQPWPIVGPVAGTSDGHLRIFGEGSCKPNRTQNLGRRSHGDVIAGGQFNQCRIWDMKTRFYEWVDGEKVEWVNGERIY